MLVMVAFTFLMTSQTASAATSYTTHYDWTGFNGNNTIYLTSGLTNSGQPHIFSSKLVSAKNNITISGPVTYYQPNGLVLAAQSGYEYSVSDWSSGHLQVVIPVTATVGADF